MRIAFLSDIHGNYTAFQAVLKDLQNQEIDQFICLGDTVTMGLQPIEVINTLKGMDCLFIKGNHDSAVLDPENAEKFEITHYLVPDLYWCHNQLTVEDRAFIEAFEPMIHLTLPNGLKLLAFHGSPLSSTHIIQATTSPEELDNFFEGQSADIYIGGHSHIQMMRRYGEKLILNSGSVGNAFKFAYSPGNPPSLLSWAEYMLLEQNGDALSVNPRRVYFDTEEVHRIARESDMPGAAWWLRQYKR